VLPKTIIHLLSGGLDSVVMLYDLVGQGHKVHALIFDYGQAHAQREMPHAVYHAERMSVLYTYVVLPKLQGSLLTDGTGTVVVPNRNAILLSMAVNFAVAAGADTVTFAANKDDEAAFPDCRQAFIQMFNHMLITAELKVEVAAPYLDKPKAWIAGLGREMGVEIARTWSCYFPGEGPCGVCPACLKRAQALA